MATYHDQAVAMLRSFEGSIPWMYLDTVGKVTVGVGLMLSNVEAAHALPFLRGTEQATRQEIAADFARVSAMKAGELAKLYRQSGGLELSNQTIDDRLREALAGFEAYLRQHLPHYDALPDAAKVALLDMSYNLGPGRLFAEYPHLLEAIRAGNWKAAAAASLRKGPSAARNAWTRAQFLSAAQTTLKAVRAEASSRRGMALLLGTLSGLAAAAATAILTGELDQLARRRRARLASPHIAE